MDAGPGGASRPELSRDGKTLAYVTRVRDKEALVLKYISPHSPTDATELIVGFISETWKAVQFTTRGTVSRTIYLSCQHPWARTRRLLSLPLMMQ